MRSQYYSFHSLVDSQRPTAWPRPLNGDGLTFIYKWMHPSWLRLSCQCNQRARTTSSRFYKGYIRWKQGRLVVSSPIWINAGEPEGVNKYSSGHLGSFNQWKDEVSLHALLLSISLSVCANRSGAGGRVDAGVHVHVCLVCLNWSANYAKTVHSSHCA